MFNHSQLFAGKMHEFFTLWIRRDDGRRCVKAGRHVWPQRGKEKSWKIPTSGAQKASHPSYEFAVNDGVRLSECVLLLMSGVFFFFLSKTDKGSYVVGDIAASAVLLHRSFRVKREKSATAATVVAFYQSQKYNLKLVWVQSTVSIWNVHAV